MKLIRKLMAGLYGVISAALMILAIATLAFDFSFLFVVVYCFGGILLALHYVLEL